MATVETNNYIAFGRVLSGTIAPGQCVRILGPNYKPGSKTDLFEVKIKNTVFLNKGSYNSIPSVPCGNTVGLIGIGEYLMKTCTVTNYENAHPIKPMNYFGLPIVKMPIGVEKASELPSLLDAFKRLSRSDPLVKC